MRKYLMNDPGSVKYEEEKLKNDKKKNWEIRIYF